MEIPLCPQSATSSTSWRRSTTGSSSLCLFESCTKGIPSSKLTGNKCAKCQIKLVYSDTHAVRSIICHTEGASRRGPRYNAQQSDDDKHSYSNLIVLCPNCHDEIDKNPQKYTVDCLLSLKKEHEARFKDNPYQLPDDMIKIMKFLPIRTNSR